VLLRVLSYYVRPYSNTNCAFITYKGQTNLKKIKKNRQTGSYKKDQKRYMQRVRGGERETDRLGRYENGFVKPAVSIIGQANLFPL